MMGFERSDDYQPLFWIKGRPVHVTPLLVLLHIAGLLFCSALQGEPVRWMRLDSDAVFHHWALWRPITYAFAHLVGDLTDSLWFLFEMYLLFMWGREVERYFGRKVFIVLYAAMLLTAPVVLLSVAALSHEDIYYNRSDVLHFGVFIAFVAIYPGVQLSFGIAAKWVAAAVLAIWTAAFMASNHIMVGVLWAVTLVAYFGARYASIGGEAFGILGNIREHFPRKAVPRGVRPRLKPRRAVDTPSYVGSARGGSSSGSSAGDRGDVHESIDPLLDKISKHGLASLTNGERATLERARVSLLRKERGG